MNFKQATYYIQIYLLRQYIKKIRKYSLTYICVGIQHQVNQVSILSRASM